jgi:hypothetical protein
MRRTGPPAPGSPPEDGRPALDAGKGEVERLEPGEQLLEPILAVAEREEDRHVGRDPVLLRGVVTRPEGPDVGLRFGNHDHERCPHGPSGYAVGRNRWLPSS